MQAFLDMLEINAQNKNGNLQTCKGRLLNQNTSAKGKTFDFRNALYVDDSMFLFNVQNGLQKHFACFGLIMHVGNSTTKSKTEAMYFPPLLAKAKKLEEEGYLPKDIKLPHVDERTEKQGIFKLCVTLLTNPIGTSQHRVSAEIRSS